jgi:hypothetical protein
MHRSYLRSRMRVLSKRALPCCRPRSAPRPHDNELNTMGRHDRPMPLPIRARRLPDDLPEGAAKSSGAAEPDVEADVSYRTLALAQQKHRTLDSPPLQVAMWRFSEHGAKAAAEMGGRNVGHCRHRAHVEWPGEGAIHSVTGAQQSPVEFLGFTAHHPRV